jgi:hypothetical protein
MNDDEEIETSCNICHNLPCKCDYYYDMWKDDMLERRDNGN